MLYSPERHCPLVERPWDAQAIKDVIADIFQNTLKNFDSESLWPTNENEDALISSNKSMYFGATGTVWALWKLAAYLEEQLPFEPADLMESIYKRYLAEPDTQEVVPSLFLGESGILLFSYQLRPDTKTADRLAEVIQQNIENPTLEILWAAPGTMVAASFMYQWTNEPRWADLYRQSAKFLINKLKVAIETGEKIWTMDMYGCERKFVGAGHGYFGNMFAMLHALDLLEEDEKSFLLDNISAMTKELATTEAGKTNWLPVIDSQKDVEFRVQWCHGSPGVINALHGFPKNYDLELEQLLIQAGELTWEAGPLQKGIALCHGTDGNGLALLQLYRRTGEQKWLERARQFASFACTQRNGRFTLFTGELGLAMYLLGCLNEDDRFPFLEYI